MPTALFSIRGLSKVYGMGEVEVHALRNVDLTLNEGEFIVLLGPSGFGNRPSPRSIDRHGAPVAWSGLPYGCRPGVRD
jgi:ABC-type phosphate/phosphonate transport system ATPase subunit